MVGDLHSIQKTLNLNTRYCHWILVSYALVPPSVEEEAVWSFDGVLTVFDAYVIARIVCLRGALGHVSPRR